MRNRLVNIGLCSVFLLLMIVSAQAQTFSQDPVRAGDRRYGSWSPPNGGASGEQRNTKLQNMLKDLNALINTAQRDRAANRYFLRDLRDLTARYANAWPRRLLFDNFTDGDYTRDPVWSVTSGDYFIEQGYGLRARVVKTPAQTGTRKRKLNREQLAISILGAVLSGGKDTVATVPQPTQAQSRSRPSVIEARVRVSNAFAVDMEFSSWKPEGRFAVGVTQGLGDSGYRVVYVPGQKGKLELLRVTARGRGVIDSVVIPSLEDKKVHSLRWTRTEDGTMSVRIDGKQRLGARDRSFRDPFDALSLRTQGADVIIKSITVGGTP